MRVRDGFLFIAPILGWLFAVASVFAQTVQGPVKFDVSDQPLSAIQQPRKAEGAFFREHRVKKIPFPPIAAMLRPDPVLQRSARTKLTVEPIRPFDGIGTATYQITGDPPDTNGSVGKDHYVQWVNSALAVFDKTGTRILGPLDGNLLWTGFGGNCENYNDGDPIVLYDKAADRWLLTQFAVSGTPFSQCIAVSTSGDPTGKYARYEYQFNDFNDYPKFGVWPDAYYGTFNMFRGNNFLGAKACAFERERMLAGNSARMQCYELSNQGGVLPADLDGNRAPPSSTPNYMLNLGLNQLSLWKFHVDWSNLENSALTGPIAVRTAPFQIACHSAAIPGECVSQPRTTQLLDTLSDRLMFRLAYRNFGDHDSLVVNHSVSAGTSTGIRWYEIRNLSQIPTIFQQGTFALDATFRWMGSIAMDKLGDMLMGYSVSSKTVIPGIRFTGRTVGDLANQMRMEQQAILGKGSQLSPDRWGDYASMSIDPTNDCTFWFSTQYLANSGGANWATAVVPVKFMQCQ
jgi:hypothetical protein